MTIPKTPRRGGYDEVWMSDPQMSFRSGNRSIGLKRISGGGVQFVMIDHTNTPASPSYDIVQIRTKDQFIKLWDFLHKL